MIAWAFVIAVLAVVVLLRSTWQKIAGAFLCFSIVLAWWLTLKPGNDAAWQPDVAKVAWAKIDGDVVTLHNVRKCDYRTKDDFTPRWETRTITTDGLPFAELRKRALINAAAMAADKSPEFSRLIREGRPGFNAPAERASLPASMSPSGISSSVSGS